MYVCVCFCCFVRVCVSVFDFVFSALVLPGGAAGKVYHWTSAHGNTCMHACRQACTPCRYIWLNLLHSLHVFHEFAAFIAFASYTSRIHFHFMNFMNVMCFSSYSCLFVFSNLIFVPFGWCVSRGVGEWRSVDLSSEKELTRGHACNCRHICDPCGWFAGRPATCFGNKIQTRNETRKTCVFSLLNIR